MSGYWIAVASAENVRRGRQRGSMQVSHGKAAPLRPVKPGDGIVYYSPITILGEKDGLQAFTAIGTIRQGEPNQVDMGGGFGPFRRDVELAEAEERKSSRCSTGWNHRRQVELGLSASLRSVPGRRV
jgi:EVE domain